METKRNLGIVISDLCLKNDVFDLRVETQMGGNEVEVAEAWFADGVLHISVTGELPRVALH